MTAAEANARVLPRVSPDPGDATWPVAFQDPREREIRLEEHTSMASATDSSADRGTIGGGGLPSQEVLPFPPTPSASRAGRTMQESTYAASGASRVGCLRIRRTS